MSRIEVWFIFEIGELVYFRGAPHNLRNIPQQFVVSERIAHECHGGIQRFYRLVGVPDLVPELGLSRITPPYQRRDPSARAEEVVDEKAQRTPWHVGFSYQGSSSEEPKTPQAP